MAEYLASIFGTEKDKVNCSFYFKIGACRHGDKCSRIHNKPVFSQVHLNELPSTIWPNEEAFTCTKNIDALFCLLVCDTITEFHSRREQTILLQNLYIPPLNLTQEEGGQTAGGATYLLANPDGTTRTLNEIEMQEHYDEFYEEVFSECNDKYGPIEEMNVCDNLGDHLTGNVYIKFRHEDDAQRAVNELNNRWFNARPIHAELSPVTDFREACCRQYEVGECTRGGFCNFMHLKPISRDLKRRLFNRSKSKRNRSKSHSKEKDGRSHRSDRERDRGHRRKGSRSRSRSRDRNRDRSRKSRERNGEQSARYDAPFPMAGGNMPFPFPNE